MLRARRRQTAAVVLREAGSSGERSLRHEPPEQPVARGRQKAVRRAGDGVYSAALLRSEIPLLGNLLLSRQTSSWDQRLRDADIDGDVHLGWQDRQGKPTGVAVAEAGGLRRGLIGPGHEKLDALAASIARGPAVQVNSKHRVLAQADLRVGEGAPPWTGFRGVRGLTLAGVGERGGGTPIALPGV